VQLSLKSNDGALEKLGSIVVKLAEDLEQQKVITQAITGENLKIKKEFKELVAQLNEEITAARLIGEQVERIGEGVKRWQLEKVEVEAKIAGIVNFQKLVLDQPDEVVLEFIRDVRRQLKNNNKVGKPPNV